MITNGYHGDDYLTLRDTGRWTQPGVLLIVRLSITQAIGQHQGILHHQHKR